MGERERENEIERAHQRPITLMEERVVDTASGVRVASKY